ncbi:MAG: energy-coupling factor transporter transmembrane component T family protein [Acidimicrobiales bacterium]
MTALGVPPVARGLGLLNPSAKLGAAVVVMVGLLVTADPLTPALVLAAELAALPLAGVPARTVAALTWPLPLAAVGVGVANLVASSAPAAVTAGISLRLIAIALPGVLVFASTDPVDLCDSLVQQLRVPARFAYGALAAFRLLPLLRQEWVTIRRARRARGIDAGRSPLGALRLFGSTVYALLVAAIRRGTRLALAMDSRGFDSRTPRTAARRQAVARLDWALLAATTAVVVAANGVAVAVGTWHPLLH